jgi:hypothetical protein
MPVIVWARELAYFVDEWLELLTARRRERRDERDLIDWLNSL